MMKMENGGHFGRHLEFRRELQGDSWGLLVCCSIHIPGPIMKNSGCYELFPVFGLYLPNAFGLLDLRHTAATSMRYQYLRVINASNNLPAGLYKFRSSIYEIFAQPNSCDTLSLPRCMECRRGLAMRILSVCPSVRPSVSHTRGL